MGVFKAYSWVHSISNSGEYTMQLAEGFRVDLPIMSLEVGNDMVKAASTDFPFNGAIIYFRHRYAEIAREDYVDEATNARRNGNPTYHLIEWRNRYFVVGDEALRYPAYLQQRQNTGKWEREYMGMFMLSALLRLYEGNPPEELTIYAAHPPRFYNETNLLLSSLLGKWTFAYPDGKHKINVVYGEPYDEIVGGVMNQSINTDGHAYAQGTSPILGGGNTLVADLGGGTFDLVMLRKDGSVDYQKLPNASEIVGGNDAFETFRKAVSVKHSKVVRGGERGSRIMDIGTAYDILLHPDLAFDSFGTLYPCRDEFERSFGTVISACKNFLDKKVPSFANLSNILVTGGVYGLIYDQMNEVLFPEALQAKRVFAVERRSDMFLGNIRGAYKMSLTKLLSLGAKAKRK
jgi:hypothetical protein